MFLKVSWLFMLGLSGLHRQVLAKANARIAAAKT